VWGHSQGGGAALMASEVAPKYAPDAQVVGAIGGAPVVELDKLSSVFTVTDSFGFMFMVAAGFRAAYPDIDLSKVMTQEGLDMVSLAESTCTDVIMKARGTDIKTYLSVDSLNTTAVAPSREHARKHCNRCSDFSVPRRSRRTDSRLYVAAIF
jgi:hypothetical protein